MPVAKKEAAHDCKAECAELHKQLAALKKEVQALKAELKKAPKGHNYWLENGQLQSNSIDYLKGIPVTWFNPDIKYVIDYE